MSASHCFLPAACQAEGRHNTTLRQRRRPIRHSQAATGSEEDEDVADNAGGVEWWADEAYTQRERERAERCLRLAAAAHNELESALPEADCPTLEVVLQYTEYISLGSWVLFEVDVHAHERIMRHFLPPQSAD